MKAATQSGSVTFAYCVLTSFESSDEGEEESSIIDEISEEPKTAIHRIAVFVDVSHVMLLIKANEWFKTVND